MKHVPKRFAGLIASSIVAALGLAFPAAAHSGDGAIELVSAESAGPLAVRYEVAITFTADGHVAPDAVATVVAEVDGVPVDPVPLAGVAGKEGRYAATVNVPEPGTWQVRFSSLEPTAILERTETIPAATPTIPLDSTIGPNSSEPVTTRRVTPPNDTFASAGGEMPVATSTDSEDANGRNSTRSSVVWLGVLGVGVGVGGAIAIRRFQRRRDDA